MFWLVAACAGLWSFLWHNRIDALPNLFLFEFIVEVIIFDRAVTKGELQDEEGKREARGRHSRLY